MEQNSGGPFKSIVSDGLDALGECGSAFVTTAGGSVISPFCRIKQIVRHRRTSGDGGTNNTHLVKEIVRLTVLASKIANRSANRSINLSRPLPTIKACQTLGEKRRHDIVDGCKKDAWM